MSRALSSFFNQTHIVGRADCAVGGSPQIAASGTAWLWVSFPHTDCSFSFIENIFTIMSYGCHRKYWSWDRSFEAHRKESRCSYAVSVKSFWQFSRALAGSWKEPSAVPASLSVARASLSLKSSVAEPGGIFNPTRFTSVPLTSLLLTFAVFTLKILSSPWYSLPTSHLDHGFLVSSLTLCDPPPNHLTDCREHDIPFHSPTHVKVTCPNILSILRMALASLPWDEQVLNAASTTKPMPHLETWEAGGFHKKPTWSPSISFIHFSCIIWGQVHMPQKAPWPCPRPQPQSCDLFTACAMSRLFVILCFARPLMFYLCTPTRISPCTRSLPHVTTAGFTEPSLCSEFSHMVNWVVQTNYNGTFIPHSVSKMFWHPQRL